MIPRSRLNAFFVVLLSLFLGMPLVGVMAAEKAKSDQKSDEKKPKPMLLGACTRDSLQVEPYAKWYDKYYEGYTPNEEVLAALKRAPQDVHITIFFGSWCGDSKREMPRFLKVLDEMSFPDERLTLIGVTNVDSLKKQSPDGEERDQSVYRVPVFIVSRDGQETNRIVEYPVLSLERDLLQILESQEYSPNYASFPYLTRWLDEGLLSDENVSYRGLANQVRSIVSTESELSSAGYVFMGRELYDEAVKVFQMNAYLYPESASRRYALAKALEKTGDNEYAERMLKKALELTDNPKHHDSILELMDVVRDNLRQEEEAAEAATEE